MAASKGTRPPAAGKGRQKGVPNKLSRELRDMILLALDAARGVEYLHRQADTSPAAFLTLLGKMLPTTLSGGDGSPLVIKTMNYAERLTTASARIRPSS